MSDSFYDGGDLGEHIHADSDAKATCPHCGETVAMALDPGGGTSQEYVEDCEVCCRPWRVRVLYDGLGVATVRLEPT